MATTPWSLFSESLPELATSCNAMVDALQAQSRRVAAFSDDAAGMSRGVVDNLTQASEQRNVVTSLGERMQHSANERREWLENGGLLSMADSLNELADKLHGNWH